MQNSIQEEQNRNDDVKLKGMVYNGKECNMKEHQNGISI